jgi:hypothetical protein
MGRVGNINNAGLFMFLMYYFALGGVPSLAFSGIWLSL